MWNLISKAAMISRWMLRQSHNIHLRWRCPNTLLASSTAHTVLFTVMTKRFTQELLSKRISVSSIPRHFNSFAHKLLKLCNSYKHSSCSVAKEKSLTIHNLVQSSVQGTHWNIGISDSFLSSSVLFSKLDCMGSCGAKTKYQHIFLKICHNIPSQSKIVRHSPQVLPRIV